jgi:outer membrane protein insertion porin family
MTGGQLRFGLPVTEEFGVTLRYSLYQQDVKIPNTESQPYDDCSRPLVGYPYTALNTCITNGEASLAIKESRGTSLTSLAGLTFQYNTLDNVKDPRNGIFAEVKTDVAGLGGDAHYFRATGDARYFHEITEDFVGIARLQGGHVQAFGGDDLRIIDHFFLGPTLVRGFASSGIGPRDVSTADSRANAIGGTTYFGGSLEVQFPIFGIPREVGLKGAVFADAGTLFGYEGATRFTLAGNPILDGFAPTPCVTNSTQPQTCIAVRDSNVIRSSVGASLLWNSPLGPIRFDYAFALTKDEGFVAANGQRVGGDRTQAFRFSGGTRF